MEKNNLIMQIKELRLETKRLEEILTSIELSEEKEKQRLQNNPYIKTISPVHRQSPRSKYYLMLQKELKIEKYRKNGNQI